MHAQEQRERQNIIADHARAVTFLINDGIYPSNTDRGYVLRFLIRRAIRNGKLLGYPNGFLTELVPAVVQVARAGLSRAARQRRRASQQRCAPRKRPSTARSSAAWRCSTRLIDDANANCTRLISGQDAFVLHDTFGFPIELTREIAAEGGVAVDTVEFDSAMDEQRERARADAKAKRAVVSLAELPARAFGFHRLRRPRERRRDRRDLAR